jgi:ABC-2 type transport system permease protein
VAAPEPRAATVAPERSARRAFLTLAGKEARAWLRSHAWWSQPAVFTVLLAGAMALIPLGALRDTFAAEPGGVIGAATGMFMSLAAVVPAFGAVFWFQNALVGERQSGTAAWVLSKPVPRWALPTAKLVVNGGLLLAASLVVPGAVAYGVLALEAGGPPAPGPFLAALGVLALNAAFYAALTLAMGAVTDARGAILAVPIAALLLGDALVGAVPVLARVSPWLLGRGAGLLAQGEPFPVPSALLATLVLAAALIAVALVRFGRQDL